MVKKINNRWISHGHIFSAEDHCDWAVSHSSLPTVLRLEQNLYRVYFSARDKNQLSHLGFFEFDPRDPKRILSVSDEPAFSPGRLGAFDCDGVYGTSILEFGNKHYCYYGGWTSGRNGLFYSSIGLAVSSDGGRRFERTQEHPILSRDMYDHWAVLAPYVLRRGDDWTMWYVSGIEVGTSDQGLESRYHLQVARSSDGYAWTKSGEIAIGLEDLDSNISRTWITESEGIFHAWYSYVKKGTSHYRLGYATSLTESGFERYDQRISISGDLDRWAGEATAYPCVFTVNSKGYMLYNGALNGRAGIGIASCDIIPN